MDAQRGDLLSYVPVVEVRRFADPGLDIAPDSTVAVDGHPGVDIGRSLNGSDRVFYPVFAAAVGNPPPELLVERSQEFAWVFTLLGPARGLGFYLLDYRGKV